MFTTRSSDAEAVGRLPFIDLWTEKMGMAIGNLSTKEGVWTLPILVAPDQRVEMSIQSREPVNLGPNERLPVSKSFLMVHSGDYQAAWKRYQDIRRALGYRPK